MKNDNLTDYLLGGNDKLIGSVIGFRKSLNLKIWENWKNDNSEVKYLPEGYAILLYFDHRTGKIERHLYNPNLTFFGKKPLVKDYMQNIIQSKSTNYINPYVFNPNKHNIKSLYKDIYGPILPEIEIDDQEFKDHPELRNNSYVSFKNLFDGKLTRYMYNLFMLEMIRDYFLNLNKNIEKIDHMTEALSFNDSITDMLKLRIKNEQTIKFTILDYPSKEDNKEIYIPKLLFSIQLNKMLIKHFNIKLIPKLVIDSPPVIKDLISMINPRTVLNNTKLSHLINKFNRINVDRSINFVNSK
jgi:hypothetical protein